MSMADDLNELKLYANMQDSVDNLAKIRLAVAHVQTGAEIILGEDHLGMGPIYEAAGNVETKVDELHAVIAQFETTVKDIADAILRSLS